jgi:hypothetical protein
MVVLVAHAIIRHRLLDLRLIAHRGTTFAILSAMFSLAALYFIQTLYPFTMATSLAVPLVPLVVLVVTLLLISAPIAPVIISLVDRYFFKGRRDRDRILVTAARRLQGAVEPTDLATELKRLLAETFAPENIAILLSANNRYGCLCLANERAAVPLEHPVDTWNTAWTFEGPLPGVILLDALDTNDRRAAWLPAAQTLRQAGFDIWIGLGRQQHKHAVVLLGPRRSGEAYLANDFAFLESLTEIATIATERL